MALDDDDDRYPGSAGLSAVVGGNRFVWLACAAGFVVILLQACGGDSSLPTSPTSTASPSPTTTVTQDDAPLPSSTIAPVTTTSSTAPTTTSRADQPLILGESSVGYLGCSMTRDAVLGYHAAGGSLIWPVAGEYAGGSLSLWARRIGTSEAWRIFQQSLDAYPDTHAIWLELCTTDRESGVGLDEALIVVSELEDRLPTGSIFVSAQPGYTQGHVCSTAGIDGPAEMADLAGLVVETGRALAGPEMGPLAQSQTRDGCHANEEGRQLMGEQLLAFFDEQYG